MRTGRLYHTLEVDIPGGPAGPKSRRAVRARGSRNLLGESRFESRARELLLAGESTPLVEYEGLGKEGLLSIPTPDHYLPLLYVIGTRQDGEAVSFPVEGVDGGSISMLSVQVGRTTPGKRLPPTRPKSNRLKS